MDPNKTLKWYRSFPQWWKDDSDIRESREWLGETYCPEHLQDRPYVIDTMPRLYMSNWDYNTVEWPRQSLFMLEWDIALDRQGREKFQKYALAYPNEVATAPYHLSDGRTIHKGFGCIYLPRVVVMAFLDTKPDRFTDNLFFEWYGIPRVCSHGVYPQHLNT